MNKVSDDKLSGLVEKLRSHVVLDVFNAGSKGADAIEALQQQLRVMREAMIYAAETTEDKHTSRKLFEALSTPEGSDR